MYACSPNECAYHYHWMNEIVLLDGEGECPKQGEHSHYGPGSHFG